MLPSSLERVRLAKDRDDVARRVLQTNFTNLLTKINITNVRRVLYEKSFIDYNFYDKLIGNATVDNEKCECLLRHLISKGDEGYRQLIQVLTQCGKEDTVQANLADELEQCYSDEMTAIEAAAARDANMQLATESCRNSPLRQHHYSESSSVSSTRALSSHQASHETSGLISIASIQNPNAIEVDNTVMQVKILVLGDKRVGKTSLILKYIKDDFDIHKKPTANLDVMSTVVNFNNRKFIINFWDPAGQSRPNTLTRRYFQGTHGTLFVYDCTQLTSLDSIVGWHEELNTRVCQRNGNALPAVLIGTKCDRDDCSKESSDGQFMCHERGFLNHYMVSAKTGENLQQSVNCLLMEILGDPDSLKESHYNENRAVTITIPDSSTGIEGQVQQHNSRSKCCT